jgi:hypothetical protein
MIIGESGASAGSDASGTFFGLTLIALGRIATRPSMRLRRAVL